MAEKMAQIRPYPGMRVAQDELLLSTYFRLPYPGRASVTPSKEH
jgi:hypothetical protein